MGVKTCSERHIGWGGSAQQHRPVDDNYPTLSFTQSFTRSPVYSIMPSCTHPSTHSATLPLSHSLSHSITITHSINLSLTHSLFIRPISLTHSTAHLTRTATLSMRSVIAPPPPVPSSFLAVPGYAPGCATARRFAKDHLLYIVGCIYMSYIRHRFAMYQSIVVVY